MICNKTKILVISIVLVLITTFVLVNYSYANDLNNNDLKYKKAIGMSIDENLAVQFLSFVEEAIFLYNNKIASGTFTYNNTQMAENTINELMRTCSALGDSYQAKKLAQEEMKENVHGQICIKVVSFKVSLEEFRLLIIELDNDKLLIQRNIGSKSKTDIDNQTREIEEKKEDVKRKLKLLLFYFE